MSDVIEDGRQIEGMVAESGMVALLNKSEIDQQIATAHKYPRSLKRFRDQTLQMVTLNEQIAQECIYSLPRDGKTIEGPSARFAEVIAHAWGNCRAGARVVDDSGDFVTSQGVFHDLEANVAITYEVQRRITNAKGKRYSADMVGVTANAASSIALRNAILKGVPKAFWSPMYQAARKTIMGDFKTLANRRAEAIAEFQRFGILPAQICATLGVAGIEDIGLEQLVSLRGLLTAIQDGDTTPEQAFASASSTVAMPQPKPKPTETPTPTEQSNSAPPPVADTSPSLDASSAGGAEPDPLLSDGERSFLSRKMDGLLTDVDMKAKFGCGVAELRKSQFAAVKAWISNPAGE